MPGLFTIWLSPAVSVPPHCQIALRTSTSLPKGLAGTCMASRWMMSFAAWSVLLQTPAYPRKLHVTWYSMPGCDMLISYWAISLFLSNCSCNIYIHLFPLFPGATPCVPRDLHAILDQHPFGAQAVETIRFRSLQEIVAACPDAFTCEPNSEFWKNCQIFGWTNQTKSRSWSPAWASMDFNKRSLWLWCFGCFWSQ